MENYKDYFLTKITHKKKIMVKYSKWWCLYTFQLIVSVFQNYYVTEKTIISVEREQVEVLAELSDVN